MKITSFLKEIQRQPKMTTLLKDKLIKMNKDLRGFLDFILEQLKDLCFVAILFILN